MRNLISFAVGLGIAYLLLWVPYAHAQAAPNFPSVPAAVDGIRNALPGVTTVANATGVAANGPVNASVPTPRGSINVPVNVAAHVSNASIARAAAKVGVRAIPGVATAIALGELADILGEAYRVNNGVIEERYDSGHPTAPPGSAFYLEAPGAFNRGPNAATIDAAFAGFLAANSLTLSQISNQRMSCNTNNVCSMIWRRNGLWTDSSATIRWVANQHPVVFSPINEAKIHADAMERLMNNPAYSKHMYDALKQDQASYAGNWPGLYNPVESTTPISVSASPASDAARVASTETITNPDGSTRTRTVTEQTTVSPVISGSTVGDIVVTYPSSTKNTTTDVDNATGATTVTDTVVNHPAPAPGAPTSPTDFPDDYNREVTQQKILEELAAEGAPDFPDLGTAATEAIDKNKDDLTQIFDALPNEYATAKESWFSWVWTPPIGECTPSTGTVRGLSMTLDICPTVSNIRDVLGWLFALFGGWQIYGEIFRRPV